LTLKLCRGYALTLTLDLLFEGPGPLYFKAFALRGTLYTLISKVDEAIKDLTQVIDSDDEHVSIKVPCDCLITEQFQKSHPLIDT